MGRRKREHRLAVIAGTEKPFRTSPEKPRKDEQPVLSAADAIMARIQAMKGATGG
ncbi:hypothetical protein LCGC14_2187430 [marine sediment metagenome]|uniref:Uncharacterized protein n=1 Tax=marine sediment metagenome TaxID=412755 RepID=A0A0F9DKH4_9ZZZZ